MGFDRKGIFKEESDYLRFLRKLKESKSKFDWIIYSYCLLPNHYHLHIQVRSDCLSKIVHWLQTSHSVYFNKKHKHFSPVFTGRFKSILVQKELYHVHLSKYIHLNPVRAGLVKYPQDYSYSSYPEIINKRNHDYKIVDRRTIKSLTGGSIKLYRKFVEETDELGYSPEKQVRGIVGTTRFISQFK
ncbi:transposase [Patescibacteria group bacterium]|nr:transposase [Patescibacteria group bacterium]